MSKVKIKITDDNTAEVIAAMKEQAELALQAIGAEAEGYAQEECPVDTSRLKNSLTWATHESDSSGGKGPDGATQGTPDELTVCVGTNVEYAEYVELKDAKHKVGKAHFIRDSLANHGNRYKEILKAALQSG